MSSLVESAFAKTVAERTARFWSVNRHGGAAGPTWRLMRGLTEGIVDFNSRRAIIREARLAGGLLGRVLERTSAPRSPSYALIDDTKLSGWTGESWTEPHAMLPAGAPRLPLGLGLLDLLCGGSIVDAAGRGSELVREVPASRYELTLDVDHIPWPQPQGFPAAPQRPLIARLIGEPGRPKSRQRGVIPAEVWIDERGRLARFSYCDLPKEHPTHDAMPWITTELWDFGGSQEIQDWRAEPDPRTREDLRKRAREPGQPVAPLLQMTYRARG